MVSKEINGVTFTVDLETGEMWREGTIRISCEKSEQYDSVHLSPPLVHEFRAKNTPIVQLVELVDWAMEALKGLLASSELDSLVWDLIEQKLTFNFWMSGLTLTDMKEVCAQYGLDWDDLRHTLEARFTHRGHACGIDSHDPFRNPTNRLNPRGR